MAQGDVLTNDFVDPGPFPNQGDVLLVDPASHTYDPTHVWPEHPNGAKLSAVTVNPTRQLGLAMVLLVALAVIASLLGHLGIAKLPLSPLCGQWCSSESSPSSLPML